MDDLMKVNILDSAFTPWGNSASLREENKGVHPTHFRWSMDIVRGGDKILPHFYTDGAMFPTPVRKHPSSNAIAWLLEPRCLRPENYEWAKDHHHQYKAVLSYDKEFLKEIPNGRWFPFGGSSIAFNKWGIYPKTRDICMVVSDKQTTEGHKLRHEIMKEFGYRIDIYGEGVGKPFESKFEILKDYWYCVVVESCFISGYFSEKQLDCLAVGTMPIYCGSYTFYNDLAFDSIEKFRDRMMYLDVWKDGSYYREAMKLGWQEKYLEAAKNYRICEDWIYENQKDLFDAQ